MFLFLFVCLFVCLALKYLDMFIGVFVGKKHRVLQQLINIDVNRLLYPYLNLILTESQCAHCHTYLDPESIPQVQQTLHCLRVKW